MIQLTYKQRENIGFQYIIDALRPCSPYGQELVRELQPFPKQQLPELKRQLENVHQVLSCGEACKPNLLRLQRELMTLRMVRGTAKKCLEAPLNEIDLFELKRFLLKTFELRPLWAEVQEGLQLQGITIEDTTAALDILDPQKNRVASFYLADSSSPALSAIRKEKRALEELLRKEPGSEEVLAKRGLVAAEEELEEGKIREQLTLKLRPYIPAVLSNMEALGDLDLTLEKARLARTYGGIMPTITEDYLSMTDVINPKVSDLLKNQNKSFTPVSIELKPGATVITGANMGGKSVALKTVALNVLLVHYGFLPFGKEVSLPIFEGLHIISEDLESVDRGLSSFGGEMVRFNQVAKQLREGFSLVILDEFARGTNPEEGSAIVQAVTQYLGEQKSLSLLATHYDKVASHAGAHYQVRGLRDMDMVTVEREIAGLNGEDSMALIDRYMNYGLYRVEGAQDCPRDAVNICRLLGMDGAILDRVEKIYGETREN